MTAKTSPCQIRALMRSQDHRSTAARYIRAETMLMAEISAREALEADNRLLRAQLAAVLGPKREVA